MAEIDLIPTDYRNERALLRILRAAGIVVFALLCVSGALSGVLWRAAAGTRADVEGLSAVAATINQQRTTIGELALRKDALESELSLLTGLRRDAALEPMLMAVVRAAPADVWFLAWQFERLGTIVATAPAGAADYFIVEPGTSAEAPRVRVQMSIAGQARDHAAVSAFVSSLLGETIVEGVRVQRASREHSDHAVDFDLLVVADSQSVVE